MKLVAEVVPGKPIEHEIAMIEPPDEISPASVGLTIAEGKTILENLQKEIVTAQVQQHGIQHSILPAVWKRISHEGLLPGHASFGVRERWHADPAAEGMFLLGIADAQLLRAFHEQEPHHTGIAVSHSKDDCVVAVWKGG